MNIQESMSRILDGEEIFGDAFYSEFFSRCPHVREFFTDTNMKRQAALLTTALILVERYYATPSPAIEQYLQYLGTKHHERKIPRELYAEWREAMVASLGRFHGNDWNPEVEAQWRTAIDGVTEVMFEGYEEHFHV